FSPASQVAEPHSDVSAPPYTNNRASNDHASPKESVRLRVGRRVPDFDGPVVTRRSQPLAVRTEGEAMDRGRVAVQDKYFLAVIQVPQFHQPAPAGRSQSTAIGAKSHTVESAAVVREGKKFLAGGHIPDLHRIIPTGRGQAPAVGTESNA